MLQLTLGEHSMGLVKCIMTYIHYYAVIQTVFIALEILCALPVHTSFFPIDLLTVSIVLLFPESPIAGIIQYVGLFSLVSFFLTFFF